MDEDVENGKVGGKKASRWVCTYRSALLSGH